MPVGLKIWREDGTTVMVDDSRPNYMLADIILNGGTPATTPSARAIVAVGETHTYIFEPANILTSAGFGMEVFNEEGEMMFSSSRYPMQVADTVVASELYDEVLTTGHTYAVAILAATTAATTDTTYISAENAHSEIRHYGAAPLIDGAHVIVHRVITDSGSVDSTWNSEAEPPEWVPDIPVETENGGTVHFTALIIDVTRIKLP